MGGLGGGEPDSVLSPPKPAEGCRSPPRAAEGCRRLRMSFLSCFPLWLWFFSVGLLGCLGELFFVDVYEDSASYSSKPRAGAKIELRTSSVELDFNTKSSTSTQIRSTISPECERGAQFQCKIVDVYEDSASYSSKPRAWSSILTKNR